MVNLAKRSRTGFEPSRTSRTGSEPSTRYLHNGGRGKVATANKYLRRPQGGSGGMSMDCLTCTNLEQALESRFSKYSEARSAPFYQVSTELAAKKKVDMERARNDMEEHQLTCPSRRASTPE